LEYSMMDSRNLGCGRAYARPHPKFRESIMEYSKVRTQIDLSLSSGQIVYE
jgi:hypothetical protein